MITENGKKYIARNYGVNNCYAMEEIVPCTVYTDGTPNVRTLDTSTILFVLVTEVADKVKTATGTFTFSDLTAANDGSYISMTNALDIEPYCIAAEPPVTPPYTPPVTPPYTPPAGAKDFEILNPNVTCDKYNCAVRLEIKNNSSTSSSVYIRVDIDGRPKFKRYSYILRGTARLQKVTVPFTGISDGYHNLTIAVGKVVDTDTFTHRFLVGVGIEPPVTPPVTPSGKITESEIVTEIRKRGTIDIAAIGRVIGDYKWYVYGGRQLTYQLPNISKAITIKNIKLRNPPEWASDILLKEDRNTVATLDRSWVLARLGELPYVSAPPTAPEPLTKAGFLSELKKRGEIDLSRVSTVPGDNKWFQLHGQVIYQLPGLKGALTIGRVPPTSTSHIQFLKNGKQVSIVEKGWALARLGELPFKGVPVTPPVTPPVSPPYTPPPAAAPTEPPEAIKAWIVANYGDGTRVTSSGWRKLFDANVQNTLAPLPSGYTKASITEGVVLWAKANPNWEVQTICAWINSIGVTNLTEDHGRYIYSLAIGWTTIANDLYDTLSPKPSRLPTALVSEDNGRGVYAYAIGWNTIANDFTGCNF